MGKTCIVLPTYNEAENLPKLVAEIEKELYARDFRIVVVDDNSPDHTALVAEDLDDLYGNIIVRRRGGKLGLGSAVVEGLKIALMMDDVDRIVTLDADLSHNPREIPRLLRAAETADLVQGSRYVEDGSIKGWSVTRRLVSQVANRVCSLFFRWSVHEYTGNFRVYSRECAETLVNHTSCSGYDWVAEAIFVALKHRFVVREVPITFRERRNGRTKLSAWDVAGWVFFVARTIFSKIPFLGWLVGGESSPGMRSHPTRVIHKSSTLTMTSASTPMVSTTTYTLSSLSPELRDHARSMNRVKSKE